jgi:hypothetical protein
MYFGLIEVPTYYMDLMNMNFMENQIKIVVVKIDDVLVYSKDEEEHEEHLRLVLQKLQVHRLYTKLIKCELDESSVFLESRHHKSRNVRGFKQDSRYVKLECPY